MNGYLTTHVLDTARGRPAEGLRITLHDAAGVKLSEEVTNEDGRTESPMLPPESFNNGIYELRFHAGDYLRAQGEEGASPLFLEIIPVRFGVSDADSHYHVPLLLSPHGYSTYRGS